MYKNGVLTYELPINFDNRWKHLFKPDFKFKEINLSVKYIKNCFVSHYGLVVKNGFLVTGCAPNLGFSNYDKSFYFKHWRKASEQYYVSKYGKSLSSISLDDNRQYLVIHSPWFSYYFWITECIPRLLKVKEQFSSLVLLYPEEWKNISFVNETLNVFDNLDKIIIPKDSHVFVSNLVMPEVKPWTPMFIPELVFETRNFLLDSINKESKITDKNKKIYISRENALRRKFSNESEVINFFSKYGYEKVIMEEHSFFDQIAIMQNSKDVASITGAGLINLLFKSEGGSFIDLTNKEYLYKDQYKFHYYKLCNILNIRYGLCFFDHQNDPKIDHYSNQNLIFDEKEIKNLIENYINYV
jgi:capsular polysaccharide biosynthesis protein